ANIVDDHLMEITHVIRGEEWLPSAPLHVFLYQCFGWQDTMPQFAHLPLLLKPDGNGKLSKRDGDRLGFPVFPLQWTDPKSGEVSTGYRESGYLPEAFINMLAFLGWNPGTEQELFSLDELISEFSLERVGKHGSKFDPEKARWFNHQYFSKLPAGDLADKMTPILEEKGVLASREYILKVATLIRERITLLPDLWQQSWFFFETPVSYDEALIKKAWNPPAVIHDLITKFAEEAVGISPWNADGIHAFVQDFTTRQGAKMGQLMTPLRLLVVGSNQGPGMMDIAEVLGKEAFLARVRAGLLFMENLK
ncbi:MAG TPA: glutamate--tRNA ligase family protein, partial [Bacteroidales bacterium]|nr:glutamate--tRNA ligase family protein [Bacteroidales bacterium]